MYVEENLYNDQENGKKLKKFCVFVCFLGEISEQRQQKKKIKRKKIEMKN